MSAIAIRSFEPRLSHSGLIARIPAAEPRFLATALLMLAALAPTGFAAFADPRSFQGIDVWVKPLKFEVALFVYLGTLAVFALFVSEETKAKRWYRVYAVAVALAAIVEIAWIGAAAALGTASHFNNSAIGAAIYSAMGLAAVLLTSASAVYAFHIARNRDTGLSPVVKESLVLGLALVLPLTLVTAGTMSGMGSHFVGGTPSDAGGFPLMGWSRDGGDLRVAHFFATHALHVVPALALLFAVFFGTSKRTPIRLFAAAYAGFVMFLFVQALMGKPFLPGIG